MSGMPLETEAEWRTFMMREVQALDRLDMTFGQTAEGIEAYLRAELPSYAQEPLNAVLRPDATEDDVFRLNHFLPKRWKFVVVLLLYKRLRSQHRVSLDAYRYALDHQWTMNHKWLLSLDRCLLRRMFDAALFSIELPPSRSSEFPTYVTIYRGTSHQSPAMAARGLSWTLRREIACFFATTYRRCGDKPVVLVARRVPRGAFSFYSNDRQEEELVCFGGAKLNWNLDPGTPEDWRRLGSAWHTRTNEPEKIAA